MLEETLDVQHPGNQHDLDGDSDDEPLTRSIRVTKESI
jgi:hypothetical protein